MTLFGWAALAGTTFAAALLQAVSGFGFAVLAVPLYLLLLDPAQAVQLAIILSTALSFAVASGLRRTVVPALLLRLSAGSLAGLIGLFSFRYADGLLVKLGAGATILAVCGDDGRVPIARGPALGAFGQDADWRSRGRGRRGGRDRADWDGRATGADLPVAGRDGGANRARDASGVLCGIIWGNSCIPCRDHRHPWPDLGGCGCPCPLRVARRLCREADRRPPRQRWLCHFGNRVARRRRALSRSCRRCRSCRNSPTMNISARPTRDKQILMQSRDEIGKSGYDRLRCAIACGRLFRLV